MRGYGQLNGYIFFTPKTCLTGVYDDTVASSYSPLFPNNLINIDCKAYSFVDAPGDLLYFFGVNGNGNGNKVFSLNPVSGDKTALLDKKAYTIDMEGVASADEIYIGDGGYGHPGYELTIPAPRPGFRSRYSEGAMS